METLLRRVGVVALCWSLMGCQNNNLFGFMHKEGSGTPQDILADADAALREHDYSTAQSYYEKVLASEPNNSQALYGAAVSQLNASGLDLGQLISNVISSTNGSSAPSFDQAWRAASQGPVSATADPNSLLRGLNVAALNGSLDQVICRLNKIRLGLTDAAIKRDDVNLLVTYGVACLLRAATRPLHEGVLDIVVVNGTYQVQIRDGSLVQDSACGLLDEASDDIIAAYQAARDAVVKLNLVDSDTLADLKSDIRQALDDLKTEVSNPANGFSASCQTLINNLPDIDTHNPHPDAGGC